MGAEMIGLLLDPEAALDAVNKAVSLVKKASATASSVESLAPMLGKYFDAKANAIASAEAAKAGSFGGSSMGKALEIELAIDSQKEFEEDLKRLFWNANKMDVWQKIKERQQQMDIEDAHLARQAKADEKKRKEAEQEHLELAIGIVVIVMLLGAVGWGLNELAELCAKTRCGR